MPSTTSTRWNRDLEGEKNYENQEEEKVPKGTCEWSDEGADMCGCPVSFFDPDAPLSRFCTIPRDWWERLNNAEIGGVCIMTFLKS